MTIFIGSTRRLAASLILAGLTLAPLQAQPDEVAPIHTPEGRVIAHPEELAPPRSVPMAESLPSVVEPRKAEELLRLDLRRAMAEVLKETPSLKLSLIHI